MQAKCTSQILDETLRALRRNRPDILPDKLDRLRVPMNRAVRGCLVAGCEPLIEGLKLPDQGDRHVLAAAIKAGLPVIVTSNLKHFPATKLRPWDIEAKSPDELVLDQAGIDDRTVAACVQQIADSRTNPPQDVDDELNQLECDGFVESISALCGREGGRAVGIGAVTTALD